MKLVVEECEVNTLADSGSQVNTVTPEFATQNGWPVLPLEDLVDHPLNLVGLGGNRTQPLGFVILRVQVKEIAGYDKDVVFLVVPEGSDFSKQVPLVIGTCTLGRVNVIKESELDMLSPPWPVVCASRLLSVRRGTTTSDDESSGDAADPKPSASAPEPETDVPVYVRESICVGAFQMRILECKVDPLQEESAEVMVIPVRSGGPQGAKIKPLLPGLQVLYVFTVRKRGSSKVSIVVRNVSESPVYLKKGIQVTRLVPATPVPPSTPTLVLEGATALEAIAEPLSMAEQQAQLLEKLDLSGLQNWAPRNAEAAEQLVLSYHGVFVLEKNELGCASAVEHEIRIIGSEPFKERFRRIPPSLLEEVCASLRDMLDAGTTHPSQSPWCNAVVLVRKKDSTLRFCMDFRRLNAWTKKDSYPLPRIQEALESMASAAHFSSMDFKSGFWQVKMAQDLSLTRPLPWAIWDFMNSPGCLLGCAMRLPPSRG